MGDGASERDVDVFQLIDGGRSRAVRQGLERLAQSIRTSLAADAALIVLTGLDDEPSARVIARSGNSQASLPLPNELVDVDGLNGATRPTLGAHVEVSSCLRTYKLALDAALVVSWPARPGTGHLIVGMTGSESGSLQVGRSAAKQLASSLRQAHELNGLRGANRLQRDTAIAIRQLAESPPGVEPEKVLESIAISARWLLGTSSSYLAMPNLEGGFTVRMHRNLRTRAFRELKVDPEKGLAGLAYRQQRPVTVVNYVADTRLIDPPIAETIAEGLVSAICAPLIADDAEVLGLVYVANRHLTPFTPADAALLDLFARHAALVLKRSRTEFNRVEVLRRLDQERLAFRLHDSVVRDLLRIGLEAAEALQLTDQSDPIRTHLDNVSEAARHCMASVRTELRELTAPASARTSNGISIGDVISRLDASPRSCVPRSFAASSLSLSTILPSHVADAILAVAEEALTNADRHSNASSVTVELRRVRDSVVLVVADDGRGMPVRDVESVFTRASGHLGFKRMRRAAFEAGGNLTIQAHEGSGLMIKAVIPIRMRQWRDLRSAS